MALRKMTRAVSKRAASDVEIDLPIAMRRFKRNTIARGSPELGTPTISRTSEQTGTSVAPELGTLATLMSGKQAETPLTSELGTLVTSTNEEQTELPTLIELVPLATATAISGQQGQPPDAPLLAKILSIGDILLLVGKAPTTNFQVSSITLCRSSSVFKAMLSDKYYEGHKPTIRKLRHINLPGDDPQAVEIFCDIIHDDNKHNELRNYETIRAVARFCDKYDATDLLAPKLAKLIDAWKDGLPKVNEVENFFTLMDTCYAANYQKGFWDASQGQLICRSNWRHLPAGEFTLASPERLLDAINTIRTVANITLHQKIQNAIDAEFDNTVACMDSQANQLPGLQVPCIRATMVGSFLSTLRKKKLYPLPLDWCHKSPKSIHGILGDICNAYKSLRCAWTHCPNNNAWSSGCNGQYRQPCAKGDLFAEMGTLKKVYYTGLNGLCLACVKAGYTDAETNCRQKLECSNGHKRKCTAEKAEDKWDYV